MAATTPWRCSRCGTVNEPGARACAGCGKWPSLFDLDSRKTGDASPLETDGDSYEVETLDVPYLEPDVYELEGRSGEGEWAEGSAPVDDDGEADSPRPLWRRLASLAFPIALVLYLVISAIANR